MAELLENEMQVSATDEYAMQSEGKSLLEVPDVIATVHHESDNEYLSEQDDRPCSALSEDTERKIVEEEIAAVLSGETQVLTEHNVMGFVDRLLQACVTHEFFIKVFTILRLIFSLLELISIGYSLNQASAWQAMSCALLTTRLLKRKPKKTKKIVNGRRSCRSPTDPYQKARNKLKRNGGLQMLTK